MSNFISNFLFSGLKSFVEECVFNFLAIIKLVKEVLNNLLYCSL